MSKKNIILLMFTAVVLFFSCYFLVTKTVIPKLRGDSGFDTSYDSGSSWDSGSNYDSGSSWDSSSSYDSGSSWDSGSSYDSDSSYRESNSYNYRTNNSSNDTSILLIIVSILPVTLVFIFAFVYLISKIGLVGMIKTLLSAILAITISILVIIGYGAIIYLLYSKIGIASLVISPIVLFIYLIIIVNILNLIKRKKTPSVNNIIKKDINLNKNFSINGVILPKIISNYDVNNFLKDRYNDYLEIQNAWMNFDYDKLKEKLTDELYNQYVMQLDTLKVKNEVNVMSDFEYKDSMIVYEEENNDIVSVTIELVVEFYDYIEKNNKLIRGIKNKKVLQHYKMIFVLDNSAIKKCPNCGEDISSLKDNICPSCHSNITIQNNNWKLSKKKSLEQSFK